MIEQAEEREPDAGKGPEEAQLIVDQVRIRGFRNLVNVTIDLDDKTTYLLGENNSGKSSVLLAVATACEDRRGIEDDLHIAADGKRTRVAEIDLIFRSAEDEFAEPVQQRLGVNAGPGPGRGEWAGIRTRLEKSRESSFLLVSKHHLQWDPAAKEWIENPAVVRRQVSQLIEAQLIDASRDLVADFGNRSSPWGRVLTDVGIKDAERSVLESDLKGLAQRIQSASSVFRGLRGQLDKSAKAQSGVESIDVRPLPNRLEDLARSIDVVVTSSGRPDGLPLRVQGLGSRSLASLMVFHALCEQRVGADLGVVPHILPLLEEPEAHLHPQAQVAVRGLIDELPGQKIVATHSNVLIAEVNLDAVRLLRPSAAGVSVSALRTETAKSMAVFRRFVSRPLGEVFFARLVVFVDGTAERISLPAMLEPLIGTHPAGRGVTIVELEGMSKTQLQKAVVALDDLGGIPWLVFVDNDKAGWDSLADIKGSDKKDLGSAHAQVVSSGKKQLETLLIDAGFEQEIRETANEHAERDSRDPRYGQPVVAEEGNASAEADCLDFLKNNKGWAAELVALAALRNGKAMPGPIIELARRIRTILRITEPSSPAYLRAAGLDPDDQESSGDDD